MKQVFENIANHVLVILSDYARMRLVDYKGTQLFVTGSNYMYLPCVCAKPP